MCILALSTYSLDTYEAFRWRRLAGTWIYGSRFQESNQNWIKIKKLPRYGWYLDLEECMRSPRRKCKERSYWEQRKKGAATIRNWKGEALVQATKGAKVWWKTKAIRAWRESAERCSNYHWEFEYPEEWELTCGIWHCHSCQWFCQELFQSWRDKSLEYFLAKNRI